MRLIGNNYLLNIPQLIGAYKEERSLLVYIYENLKLNLYVYDFEKEKEKEKEYKTRKYMIGELIRGSADNFGGYDIHIHEAKIKQNYVFNLKYRRAIGPVAEFIFTYNTQTGKVVSFRFKDNPQIIKDERKLFPMMDLTNQKNK